MHYSVASDIILFGGIWSQVNHVILWSATGAALQSAAPVGEEKTVMRQKQWCHPSKQSNTLHITMNITQKGKVGTIYFFPPSWHHGGRKTAKAPIIPDTLQEVWHLMV